MIKIKAFFRWLIGRTLQLPPRYMVVVLSVIIGVATGLIAVLLKNLVHITNVFILEKFDINSSNFLYFVLPLIGILLTVLYLKWFVKDDISHGISKVLYAIAKKHGHIKSHNNYTSVIASTLTVAFGGSVGLEAPVVLTGSSIGSTLARFFGQNHRTTILLVGCGAAGAIAAIFKAPITAVIFSLEVLMLDLTLSSVLPLLISAATSASVSYLLLGKQATFYFSTQDPFVLSNIPLYILLGIICGFVSLYFSLGTEKIEKWMSKITKVYYKIALGGIVVGLLIYLFPPLYGEGYQSLKLILTGQGTSLVNGSLFYNWQHYTGAFILFLVFVVFFKMFASALTTSSGGVGGVFAPSLFLGGVTGYIASILFSFLPGFHVSEKNISLVGMAGIMSGVMHAPLTSVFLIAEITGGYSLFVPLMLTSAISFLTVHIFEKHSIYTKRLALKGELMTHNKDKTILMLLKPGALIDRDFDYVLPDQTLGDLVKLVRQSKRNVFPVLDVKKHIVGMVMLEDIREILFDGELYSTTDIQDLMTVPPAIIFEGEPMLKIMNKFDETGAWTLPVVDAHQKYVGFLSKARIYAAYRNLLSEFSEE
jgi:CIC family chloride channel protein